MGLDSSIAEPDCEDFQSLLTDGQASQCVKLVVQLLDVSLLCRADEATKLIVTIVRPFVARTVSVL